LILDRSRTFLNSNRLHAVFAPGLGEVLGSTLSLARPIPLRGTLGWFVRCRCCGPGGFIDGWQRLDLAQRGMKVLDHFIRLIL